MYEESGRDLSLIIATIMTTIVVTPVDFYVRRVCVCAERTIIMINLPSRIGEPL